MESNFKSNAVQSLPKRVGKDQDPDYNEAAPPDKKRLKSLEENARSHLGERVKHILNNHFELEVSRQHNEILEIDKCIAQVQQKLQILRYVATRSFFSTKTLQSFSTPSTSQADMHPAVKNIVGKRPIKMATVSQDISAPTEEVPATTNASSTESIKIPRYIPPKLPEQIVAAPVRGELHFLKKKLIIGNISRWIPISERDDTASHKWMVYVRGSKEEPNVSTFVSQVVFFLHPSYAPHDVVHVMSHPFHVTRRGWGEFPLRIQVHFCNPLCKPVNIIHNLKLDRSYTGLQTLGAETIVDVMVYDEKNISSSSPFVDEITCNKCVKLESLELTPEDIGDMEHEECIQSELHLACDGNLPENVNDAGDTTLENNTIIQTLTGNEENQEENQISECPMEIDISSKNSDLIDNLSAGDNQLHNNEMTNIDRDHDYFSTGSSNGTKKCESTKKENSAQLVKPHINVEQLRGLLSSSALAAGSITNSSAPSQEKLGKPVLVRCFNKNGTVFKLPLALLRSSVITLQPYRVAKPGESLLRPQPLKTPEPLGNSGRLSLGKVATVPSSKADVNRQDKVSVESRFINERTSFEAALEKIRSSCWNTVRDCVRILARNLPLIDTRAEDPVFRSVRPFSSSSSEVFHSWSVGKQRSAEWSRAKLIRLTLERSTFTSKESIWSTKKIMIWCRRQGYSPLSCWPQSSTVQQQSSALSTLLSSELNTLSKVQFDSSRLVSEDDVNVEIESLTQVVKTSPSAAQFQNATFLLKDPEPDLTLWIADSIEKHGFKLGAELCDDFLISLSRLLLSHIWRGIADDILRRSLREAWLRTRGAVPEEISWIDTYRAVTRRPQFDILTNAGLGVDDSNKEENA